MKSYAEAVKGDFFKEEPFQIDWIYCNQDHQLPILRTPNLLSLLDMDEFLQYFPEKKILKESTVYSSTMKKEIKSDYVRHSKGVREKSKMVLENIEEKIIQKIILSCQQHVPQFFQCIFRGDETEWLLYTQGDFFKVHQDFERYVCDNMAPYVLLYGLENTNSGGETVLYDYKKTNVWNESCKKNGAVFFPGHMPHESRRVLKGIKKCLKLECFVFFHSPTFSMIECKDPCNCFPSFWTPAFLKEIDCYLSSMFRFDSFKEGQDKKKIISELAESLVPYFVALHDRQKVPSDSDVYDFLFPNLNFLWLQDLYTLTCYMNNIITPYTNTHDIFMAKTSTSWKWFHETYNGSDYLPLICVWTKSSKDEKYFMNDVYCKNGKSCYSNYFSSKDINSNEYIDFEKWMSLLQRDKIVEKENRRTRYGFHYRKECKKTIECFPSKNSSFIQMTKECWEKIYRKINTIQPNDQVNPPKFHSASFQREVTEMCNCEDLGFETYIEDVYITLYIQIRWILVKLE